MAHVHRPIKQVSDIGPGDHLCCIYSTDEEHRAVFTRFLLDGLKNHEKVFYIVDARTAETILGYLKDTGLDVDSYLQTGQFSILTVSDSYMKDGVFDPDRMIALLSEETGKALREGYSALRVTGEMSWALRGLPGSERLIEYEHKLNTFFPGSRCMAVCQYDRRRFDQDILLHVLMTHPFAFIGEHLYDNFYFTPPEEFLDPGREKTTLDRWIANLKDRKVSEEALRRSEERYRALFDHMLEGFALCRMIYDEGGRPADWEYIEVNPAFGRLTGLQNIVGKKVSEAIPGTREGSPGLFEIYGRVASTGIPETFDTYFTPLSLWLHISVSCPERGYFVAVFEDITEKKKAEERSAFLSAIVDSSRDGIIGKTLDGIITSWNPGAEKIYGYPAQDMIGRPVSCLVPPGHPDDTAMILGKIHSGEPVIRYDTVRMTKEGRSIDVSLTVSPIRDGEGHLLGASTIVRDITEQKAAEKALRRSEETFRNYIENAPDGIFVADVRGNYLMVNNAACELTGYSREELAGKNLSDLVYPDDRAIAAEHFRRVKEEGQVTGETRFVTRSGEVRYWLVKAVRMDEERLLGFASDITDQKLMVSEIRSLNAVLEQRVEERTEALASTNVALEEEIAQRTETEDQLRAALNEKTLLLREVHHRVKNNLQIIISLTNLQLRQVEDPHTKQIMAETQNRVRAMALVHEKLYRSENLSDIDLMEYIRYLSTQLFGYYGVDTRKVALEVSPGKVLVPISTAIPLGLIINELVSNSLKHAFPGGRHGALSVSASRERDTVTMDIRDTGIGMPEGFDWRSPGSLGLRLVLSLVNQLDGTIDLERGPGTAFHLALKVKE